MEKKYKVVKEDKNFITHEYENGIRSVSPKNIYFVLTKEEIDTENIDTLEMPLPPPQKE